MPLMVRDLESKKKGYSARSYKAVLDDQIPRMWQPGMLFMQDIAPIHRAKIIEERFEAMGIPRLEWPPYSPDLNPIENLWAILKNRLIENWQHLLDGGRSEDDLEALKTAIKHEWDNIPQEVIDACILGVEKRVDSVLKAKGWYTHRVNDQNTMKCLYQSIYLGASELHTANFHECPS